MLNVQAKILGTETILNLTGQLVIGETENLRNAVQSLPNTSKLILDLSHVTVMDAHGVGVMLALHEQSREKGALFELANVNRRLLDILQIARLDSVFHINQTIKLFPRALPANRTVCLSVE